MRKNLICSLLLVSVCFTSLAAGIINENYVYDKDIQYKEGNGYISERCRLDVAYVEEKGEPRPVLVWFHGGGLTKGQKGFPQGILRDRAIVVSVEYRLSPQAKVEEIIDDAAAAVAWTFGNIAKYGGDNENVFLSGMSAGAYLSAMLGMAPEYLKRYSISPESLAGIIPVSGQMMTHFTHKKYMGIEYNQPVIDKFAPLYHVMNKTIPPVLLITGDRTLEMAGRYEENDYLEAMLIRNKHKDVTLYEMQGYTHNSQLVRASIPQIYNWIGTHLRGASKIASEKAAAEAKAGKATGTAAGLAAGKAKAGRNAAKTIIAKDIPYLDAAGDSLKQEKCKMVISYPGSKEKKPVVLFFHGGGLKRGERHIPEPLQTEDFVSIGAGYRLSPEVTVSELLDDCAACVAWVFKNAHKYGGDPDGIFLTGSSGGAYIALMLLLDKHYLEKYGIDSDKVAGAVSISGQVITHQAARGEKHINRLKPTIDNMAPLYHMRADSSPILLLAGDRRTDLLCRRQENAYMAAMMKHIGHKDITFYHFDGVSHNGMGTPSYPLMIKWIKEHYPRK